MSNWLKLTGVELGNPPYDYENALVARAPTDHHRILMVLSSPVFFPDRERLAQLALRHPTLWQAALRVPRHCAERAIGQRQSDAGLAVPEGVAQEAARSGG
jgi:hypothetical protein